MHDLTLRQVSRLLMCGVQKIIWLALLQEMVCMINDLSWLPFSQGEEKGRTFVTLKVQSIIGWGWWEEWPSLQKKMLFFTLGKKEQKFKRYLWLQGSKGFCLCMICFYYCHKTCTENLKAKLVNLVIWQFKDPVVACLRPMPSKCVGTTSLCSAWPTG